MSDMFDIREARLSLELQRNELLTEVEAHRKLLNRFDMIHNQMDQSSKNEDNNDYNYNNDYNVNSNINIGKPLKSMKKLKPRRTISKENMVS